MRSSGRVLTLLALCGIAGGCAFEDGLPWGLVEFDLSVRFDPAPRLDDQGRIRTTDDYAVQLDRLALSVDALTLTASAGGGTLSFDPAAPPSGYSLCHGGHCHADDGRLVAYEDIELELAQGGSGGPSVTRIYTDVVEPSASGVTPQAGACSNDCEIGRGELRTVQLALSELAFEGRVFDRLTGDKARLPPEGIAASGTLPLALAPAAAVGGKVNATRPVGLHVRVVYAVPVQLFDGLDWATETQEAAGAQITLNLAEHGALDADITRFDP